METLYVLAGWGLFLSGVVVYQFLSRYVFPIMDIPVTKRVNESTKRTTIVQQEIYDIQSGAGQIQEPCIGFDLTPEEEYYDDEE